LDRHGQYDYDSNIGGLPSGNSLFFEYQGQGNLITNIDRVVSERRASPDGVNLEGSTTYSFAPQIFNGTSYACTEVKGYQGSSATGTLLMRQRHFFLASGRYLTGNIGGGAFGTGYSLWSTGVEWRAETRDASGGGVNAVEQDWAQRASVSWTTGYTQEQPANDNRVSQTRNYLNTGSFAKSEIFYDNINHVRANNVAEVKEYDFDLSLRRRTTTSYLTINPVNGQNYGSDSIFLLKLPTQQSVYEGSTEKARTVYEYDKYVNDGNNAALTDYASVTGHDPAYGVSKTTRGNATAVGRWLNTSGATLYAYSRHDKLGNVVSVKDPRGNVTTISFTDNFGNGDNPDSGASGAYGPTYSLPTLITSPQPNPGEAQQTAKSQYDFSTGLLTGFKDRHGIVTKTEYNDVFNRPTRVTAAKGVAGAETQTAMYYAPQSNPYGVTLAKNDVLTAKDRDGAGDGILRAWTVTDGFGRASESWTRHPQGDVKVSTIYDALGRAKQTSNPYRLSESPVYTTTTYDLAGRVTAVTTPDGATVSTAYDGARVMVTDQAQKKRISETDGLGRLLKVWEVRSPDSDTVSITFPQSGGTTYYGYLTQYTYDALDNLTTVAQGVQTRTFVYDSLNRLTSATNPESGTVTYTYDNNGNLTSCRLWAKPSRRWGKPCRGRRSRASECSSLPLPASSWCDPARASTAQLHRVT
jgi:YD repeat-containing protein